MNILALGEQSAKGLPNVSPMGRAGSIDLGGNHLVSDANWIENNHSHPGFDPLNPSGFERKYNKGPVFSPVGVLAGDRGIMSGGAKPNSAYLYGPAEKTYIKYDSQSATIIGNRR